MTYGYLRVSRDTQDVASQKIGVAKKARELGLKINEWIADEGVSGVKEYDKRNLGNLIEKLGEGDVLVISEISRLARSVFMLFRIIEICNSKNVTIHSVKDSISTVKPGDIATIMMLFCFGVAAQIEREMIIKRTVEGIERAKKAGVIFGRPLGSKSLKTKITGREKEIQEMHRQGFKKIDISKKIGISRTTLYRHRHLLEAA